MAFRIATLSVSIVDLSCLLEKVAKHKDVKKVVKQASDDLLKDILDYAEDRIVSVTLRMTPTLLCLMLGLALLSVTTLSSLFSNMAMNLAAPTSLQGVRTP